MPYVNVGKENSGSIDIHYEDWGEGKPVIHGDADRILSIQATARKGLPDRARVGFSKISAANGSGRIKRRRSHQVLAPNSGYNAADRASPPSARALPADKPFVEEGLRARIHDHGD